MPGSSPIRRGAATFQPGERPGCGGGARARSSPRPRRRGNMPDNGPSSSIAGVLAALGNLQVHDASPTIAGDMPMWFMYEAPEIAPLFGHAEAGAAANRVALSEHTGTHVDAPFHFDANGLTADQLPVDAMLLRPFGKYDL